MPNWQNYLTDSERAELAAIDSRMAQDRADRRKLAERCKKRGQRGRESNDDL